MKFTKSSQVVKRFCMLISIILLLNSCSQSSSNENQGQSASGESQNQTPLSGSVIKSEITGVYALFEVSLPSDGEWSGEQDYNSELEYKYEYEEVKENKELFYCYDTQKLIKLEILGYVKDATVEFTSVSNEKNILLKNGEINGLFVIAPSSALSYLNGGLITVKSGNKILRTIRILYEGCL